MRFKSKKKRVVDIERRSERMGRILVLATTEAMKTDDTILQMLPEVIEQLRALSAAPLEAQEAFLTMLESGIPERFKHIK